MNETLISIPGFELPFFKHNNLSDIEILLSLKETETIMKELGAGTHVWGEPSNYACSETVLSFLNRNIALATEIRLKVLGVY